MDNEVLKRAKMDGMEEMLMRAQLRWVGHVQRMSDNRMPKQIFYKDTLKQTLKMTSIDTET